MSDKARDALLDLADELDSQAAIASRHGQMYELEAIAARLRDEHARIHSWNGLMALLDEHYPADVFTGSSDDPGPRIVALIRTVDHLRSRLAMYVGNTEGAVELP